MKTTFFPSSDMLSHLLCHLAALTSLLVICFHIMNRSIHVYSLMLNKRDSCGALHASGTASNTPSKAIPVNFTHSVFCSWLQFHSKVVEPWCFLVRTACIHTSLTGTKVVRPQHCYSLHKAREIYLL